MSDPLRYHPLANIFPLLEGASFDELVADIKSNGLTDSIVLHEDGSILDGRNRYRACIAAEVDARMEMFHGADPLAFVISKNLKRRHLNESQRAYVAARLTTLQHGGDRRSDQFAEARVASANLPLETETPVEITQSRAAELLNVSERSVRDAVRVRDQATAELQRAVERGHLAVSAAVKAVALAEDTQRMIAEEAEAGRANVVRTVIKRESRVSRERDLGEKQVALPNKKYGVVLADPEWKHKAWSEETGEDRSAGHHYPLSETEIIASRPVVEITDRDCILFLWATASMLEHALVVMAAWGFTYKSHFIWAKDRVGRARGMGRWLSDEHELLLIGTRGSVPAPTGDLQARSVQHAPVGEHSEKPELFHEIIEHYFPTLPKIELNRRGLARPGWDAWGNEATPPIAQSAEESREDAAPTPPTDDYPELPACLRRKRDEVVA